MQPSVGLVMLARRLGTLVTVVAVAVVIAGCDSDRAAPTATEPVITAAQLEFTTHPPATVEGNVVMGPAIQVTARDAAGALLRGARVTMRVGAVPPTGRALRLSGTLAVKAVNGVATFSDLRVDRPGTGYTLVAVSGSAVATSDSFAVQLTFTSVMAGGLHTCGLALGGAYCWGLNLYGQLGGGATVRGDPIPVLATSELAFVQTAAGEHHSCGLTADGAQYCWGYNNQGHLGNGTLNGPDQCPGAAFTLLACYLRPVRVTGSGSPPLTFTSVSSGPLALHTCGLTSGGRAYCWGYNGSGQVGDGTSNNFRTTPVYVAGSGVAPLVFTTISAGGGRTCGVTTDRAVYCWGFGLSATPALVAGSGTAPLEFVSVSARRLHVCGVTTAGAVYCWGSNGVGQLGDGTLAGSATPVLVAGSGTPPFVVSGLGVGDDHACALASAGALYCWGRNTHGQLGDGTTMDRAAPVQAVGSGMDQLVFTGVTAGEGHTCGLTAGGRRVLLGVGLRGRRRGRRCGGAAT